MALSSVSCTFVLVGLIIKRSSQKLAVFHYIFVCCISDPFFVNKLRDSLLRMSVVSEVGKYLVGFCLHDKIFLLIEFWHP